MSRYYSHGVELVRLRNLLGVGTRPDWLLRLERRMLLALRLVRPFWPKWTRERIVLQRETLRGMLDEHDSWRQRHRTDGLSPASP